jgi:hypothetical protein
VQQQAVTSYSKIRKERSIRHFEGDDGQIAPCFSTTSRQCQKRQLSEKKIGKKEKKKKKKVV